jgi:hypothetical protein
METTSPIVQQITYIGINMENILIAIAAFIGAFIATYISKK